MTEVQCLITAAAIMLGTMATRFAPFVLLPKNRPVPKLVEYLGGTLPYAATVSYTHLTLPTIA